MFGATSIISVLVSAFFGILGIIAYKRYEFYPAFSDAWRVITKGIEGIEFDKVDSAIDMMVGQKLILFIIILFLIRFIFIQLVSGGIF